MSALAGSGAGLELRELEGYGSAKSEVDNSRLKLRRAVTNTVMKRRLLAAFYLFTEMAFPVLRSLSGCSSLIVQAMPSTHFTAVNTIFSVD